MSRKLFDSTTQGIIKFFIRPDDLFALNSLELLDANEYLYRVLKNEGYQRVIFFEEAAVNNIIFTYDKLSQLSYLYPDYFKDVDIGSADSVSIFYSKVKAEMSKTDDVPKGLEKNESSYDNIPEYGKREIKTFSKIDTLIADFSNEIQKALLAENIKTAIVFEMDIFNRAFERRNNDASDSLNNIIRAIKRFEKKTKKENIILFTLTKEEDFSSLKDNSALSKMFFWMTGVNKDNEFIKNVIKKLDDYGIFVSCNAIGADEIANFLLRKKIIDNDQKLKDIPYNKIYSLALCLKDHLSHTKQMFSDNVAYNINPNAIKFLTNLFEDENFISELISLAGKLKPYKTNSIEIQNVEIDRVYKKYSKFPNKSSASLLSELSKDNKKYVKKRPISKEKLISLTNIVPDTAIGIEDTNPLFEATKSAILYVQTDEGTDNEGTGTAFLISPDGYAITCSHVVDKKQNIKARFRMEGRPGGNDQTYECEVIKSRSRMEIALVKLKGGDNFPYLKLADECRKIQRGEKFIMGGYPMGKETNKDLTMKNGSIASSGSQRDPDSLLSLYYIDGSALRGDSGSPIISCKDGCVIGVFVGDKGGNRNFMRPISYFWEDFFS